MIVILKSVIMYIFFTSLFSSILKLFSFNYFVSNTNKLTAFKFNRIILTFSLLIFLLSELIVPIHSLLTLEITTYHIALILFLHLTATIMLIPVVIQKSEASYHCGCYGNYFKEEVGWNKIIENVLSIIVLTMGFYLGSIIVSWLEISVALSLLLIKFLKLSYNNTKEMAW